MEEICVLDELPMNEQIVFINIVNWSSYYCEAKYFSVNQTFEVIASGLLVQASLVNFWKEV